MDALFGAEMSLPLKFFIAFAIVLCLIGAAAYLVRRFGAQALGTSVQRGRQPRLAVVDAAPIDNRRRLLIVRRDNVEHLLLWADPPTCWSKRTSFAPHQCRARVNFRRSDRSPLRCPLPRRFRICAPRAAPAEPAPPRPKRAESEAPSPWPLQPAAEAPARPAPAPIPAPAPAVEAAPAPPAPPVMPIVAPPVAPPIQAEPARPVPVEPVRPVVAEPVRPVPVEPVRVVAVEPEPVAVPPRVAELTPAWPPPSVEPAAAPIQPATASATDDQNLADMAFRLEAALRRPLAPDQTIVLPSRPISVSEPPVRAVPAAQAPEVVPPPVTRVKPATEPPRPAPSAEPRPDPRHERPVYEGLEREMANLLGRPLGSS